MEIHIDRDELRRIQQKQQKLHLPEDDLNSDYIGFDAAPEAQDEPAGSRGGADAAPPPTKARPTATARETPSKRQSEGDGRRPAPSRSRLSSVLRFNVPWADSRRRRYSRIGTELLHQEIVDFANYVSPTEEERFSRVEAMRRLTEVVQAVWPAASVQVFGSFDSQLYLPSSDLDAVVVMEGLSYDEYAKPPLNRLAKALLKAAVPVPETIKVITKARVPIVKYTDAQTDFHVDVSFNVASGLEAAKFMRAELAAQPALRPLTLLLKHFLGMRSLNEVFSGGLGSYSIMCLAISFLQTHPLVQSGLIRAHENLGVLLIEFFELYGRNFNYEAVGISVVNGGCYFSKEDRGWLQDSKPHLLSIEDPQNSENDISKGSFAIGAVRQSFEHALNILKCCIAEHEKYTIRQMDDAARGLRPDPKHTPSILGSIITLDDALLRHRYYIQQTTNL